MNSLELDWNKPLIFRNSTFGCTSFQKAIASANKTLSKAQKFIDRIDSAKRTSMVNAETVPPNATIREEYVRCGKRRCEMEPHGPYFYAYWKQRIQNDEDPDIKRTILKKKYIGTRMGKQG